MDHSVEKVIKALRDQADIIDSSKLTDTDEVVLIKKFADVVVMTMRAAAILIETRR